MENNATDLLAHNDEQVIDLKELTLYVCRKWRALLILGILGLILGACFGFLKGKPSVEDLDIDDLHLMEIEQYARYNQLYENQLAYEQESVYLNMDPQQAYQGSVRYYLKLQLSNSAIVSQQYRSILRENSVYDELIEVSGLNCTLRAIQELVSIGIRELDRQDQLLMYEDYPLTVEVSANVTAPTAESCQNMLDILDGHVQEANQWAETHYGVEILECAVDPCEKASYLDGVVDAKKNSTAILAEYTTKLNSLLNTLTDDDKLYYEEIYVDEPEEALEGSLSWLKWSVIFGVLFGMACAFCYAIAFLLDGHVKNLDELLAYGMYPIAFVKESRKKHNVIDRLFVVNYTYHTDDYLIKSLQALGMKRALLSGNFKDDDVRQLAERIGKLTDRVMFSMSMTVDADTQLHAQSADGVILVVHLWKTKRVDFEQEIRTCRRIGAKVVGVVAIG